MASMVPQPCQRTPLCQFLFLSWKHSFVSFFFLVPRGFLHMTFPLLKTLSPPQPGTAHSR